MFSVRPLIGWYCVALWIGFITSSSNAARAQSFTQNWLLQTDLSVDCELTALATDTINGFYYLALAAEGISDAEVSQIGSITSETELAINSNGDIDVYIFKLNNIGEILWAISAGGNGNDRIEDMAVGVDGSLYFVGHYSGTFDFESISGEDFSTLPDNGGINESNAIIACYSSNGNLQWYRKEGGNNNDKYFAVDITSQGVVAIGTYFENNSEDLLGINVTSPNNDEDVFIASYTYTGNPLWLLAGGSAESDYAHQAETYPSNFNLCTYRDTIYFVASFAGTTFDFDYSTNYSAENLAFSLTNPTSANTYVLGALSNEGQIVWLQRQRQSGTEQSPMGIAADCNGVYVSGTAYGSLIWEGDIPSVAATVGGSDIFIAKYNKDNGGPEWFQLLTNSTGQGDFSSDLVCDKDGNVVSVGRISSSTSVQGNTMNGDSQGSAFVLSMNGDGDYQAHTVIDSMNEDDFLLKIQLDLNKNIFVGGSSGGDLDANQISANTSLNAFISVLQNNHITTSQCCSGIPFMCSGDTLITYVNAACEAFIPDLVGMYGTGNCPEYSYIQSPTAGSIFGEGLHTVTISNFLGDIVCMRTIEILDTIVPVLFGCPGDQEGELSVNCDYVVPDYISLYNISVLDNCSNPTLLQTPAPGSYLTTSSLIEITNNGEVVCSFWLTLSDNSDPIITGCPGDITLEYSNNCSYTVPNFIAQYGISVSDNCNASFTLVQDPAPGEIIYSNTIVSVFVQEFPSVSCSFYIDLIDLSPPTILCSPEILTCDQTVYYFLDFTDNCAFENYDISPSQYFSGAVFPIGTTTVTVNAWDIAGNSTTCSFNVVVNPSDCCTPANLPLIAVSNLSPCFGTEVEFSLLQYFEWIEWYGSMDGGNSYNQLPYTGTNFSWTAQSDFIVKALVSVNGCTPVWTAPVTVDIMEIPLITADATLTSLNCQASMPDLVSAYNVDPCWNFMQNIAPGTNLSPGIYNVQIEEQNSGSLYTGEVIVLDLDAPVIEAENEINFISDEDCAYVLHFDELNVSFIECQLEDTIVLVNGEIWNFDSPISVFHGDILEIQVSDESGNTTDHQIAISVSDLSCPVFNEPGTDFIDIQFDDNCGFMVDDYRPVYIATDNCDGIISPNSVVQIPPPGTFITENTTVELAASDNSGNNCSKYIELVFEDVVAPELVCPDSVFSLVDLNCIGYLVDLISLVEVEECTPFTIYQYPASGTTFYDLTPTEISLQVQDEFGNIAACSVPNFWNSVEQPIFSWPVDQSIFLEDECSIPAPDFTSMEVENSCGHTILQNPLPGTLLGVGSNEISLVISFVTGEILSHSFDLEIVDSFAPQVYCPNDSTLDAEDGLCGAIYSYEIEVWDNCGVAESNLISGFPSGDVFPIGIHQVEYEVMDLYGNTNSCIFEVVVQDILPPQVSTIDITSCSPQVFYDLPLVSDACNYTIAPDAGNIESGGTFPFGNTLLSWTISDEAGNVSIATQTITIIETPIAGWLPVPEQVCENEPPIDLQNLLTNDWTFEFNSPFNSDNLFDPSSLGPGIYELVLTVTNGTCFGDSTQFIEVLTVPEMVIPEPVDICGLQANLEIQTTGQNVEWFLPDQVLAEGSTLEANVSLIFPEYGSYQLPVESSNNGLCAVNAELDVTLWEQPTSIFAGEDQILYIIDHTLLEAQYSGPGQLSWSSESEGTEFSNPQSLQTEVSGLIPGFNTVYITASNGSCPDVSDELLMEVKGLIIPTVFSPNNDGFNETFEIRGLENLPVVKLTIFDDWGMEIFSTDNYNNQWNGTLSNGKLCIDGTYYYALEIEKEVLMGFVEINR